MPVRGFTIRRGFAATLVRSFARCARAWAEDRSHMCGCRSGIPAVMACTRTLRSGSSSGVLTWCRPVVTGSSTSNSLGIFQSVPGVTRSTRAGHRRDNPLSAMFRVDNLLLWPKLKMGTSQKDSAFSGGLRRLTNDRALSVRVASSAVTRLQEGGYEPANLAAFGDATDGFAGIVEPVVALPETGVDFSALGSPPAAAG